MAKAPRFVAQVRTGGNVQTNVPFSSVSPGAALQRGGGGLLDQGFDQLTRTAVQESQQEGLKAGAAEATAGAADPTLRDATISGQAYNRATQSAFNRRRTRMETISTIRAVSGFRTEAQTELERLQTEDDVTRNGAPEEYSEFLSEKIDNAVAESGLSEEGRLQLQAELESDKMRMAGQMGQVVSTEQRKMVMESADAGVRSMSAKALRDPEDMIGHFSELDTMIDRLAPALSPDEELAIRDEGRQTIIKSAVTGMLSRGDSAGARDLIDNTPGLIETMAPGQQRAILGGILEQERAAADKRNVYVNKINALERAVGPLTRSQKFDALSLSTGPQSNAELIAESELLLERPLSNPEKAEIIGVDVNAVTDVGKHIQDREMFANTYGENSPQLQAFDEAAGAHGKDIDQTDISTMRKEFTSLSKDFVGVRDAANKITAASKISNGAAT